MLYSAFLVNNLFCHDIQLEKQNIFFLKTIECFNVRIYANIFYLLSAVRNTILQQNKIILFFSPQRCLQAFKNGAV